MNKKWIAFSAVAGFLIFVGIGCGQTPAYTPPSIPQTTVATVGVAGAIICPAGSFNINDSCYPTTDFPTACSMARGQLISVSGATVCKVSNNYVGGTGVYGYSSGSVSFSTQYVVPSIDPTAPQNTYNALPVVIGGYYGSPVRTHKNDTLRFNSTGGWSYNSANSYSKYGFTFSTNWKVSCNDVNVDGLSTSGGQTVNASNGQPAALYASDGTSAYKLGSNARVVILNEGALFLGFNAPSLNTSSGCSTGSISTLIIDRCVDASGNLYPCP